jgi:hypothetical protein
MYARAGDELTVRGRHEDDEDRYGTIVRVDGRNGAPPYLVRWNDGEESVFFPVSGVGVEHHLRRAPVTPDGS